jgi:hypothetical protein
MTSAIPNTRAYAPSHQVSTIAPISGVMIRSVIAIAIVLLALWVARDFLVALA